MNGLSPHVQAQLCNAILTLLGDETGSLCPEHFVRCSYVLDFYRLEIPGPLLTELQEIIDSFVKIEDGKIVMLRSPRLSDEKKQEIAEQLLAIYIDIKGGNLIF